MFVNSLLTWILFLSTDNVFYMHLIINWNLRRLQFTHSYTPRKKINKKTQTNRSQWSTEVCRTIHEVDGRGLFCGLFYGSQSTTTHHRGGLQRFTDPSPPLPWSSFPFPPFQYHPCSSISSSPFLPPPTSILQQPSSPFPSPPTRPSPPPHPFHLLVRLTFLTRKLVIKFLLGLLPISPSSYIAGKMRKKSHS